MDRVTPSPCSGKAPPPQPSSGTRNRGADADGPRGVAESLPVSELLRRAHEAGLRVSVQGDRVQIQGPRGGGDLAKLILQHKSALLAFLRAGEPPVSVDVTKTPKPSRNIGVSSAEGANSGCPAPRPSQAVLEATVE